MKSIWLLVGEANTRKSSTVRSLLGLGKTGVVEVEFLSGAVLPIWGAIRAAQEHPLSPTELLAVLNENVSTVPNVLLPLRYDPAKRQPSAEVYVKALLKDGWIVRYVVSFGEPARSWLKTSGLPYIEVPKSTSTPCNTVAAHVRATFGWL